MTVKIDKKAGIGSLECKVCGQRFQCTINCTTGPNTSSGPMQQTQNAWLICTLAIDLSAAVDVYGEWVDAAEAVAKGEGDAAAERHLGEPSRAPRKDRHTGNDSDTGEPEYSGEGIVGDDEEY